MAEKKYVEQDENGVVIGEMSVDINKQGEGSYFRGLFVDPDHIVKSIRP